MTDNIGRSADADGLSSLRDVAAKASPPEASIPSAGDWIVYSDRGAWGAGYKRAQIEKVTPKQFRVINNSGWGKLVSRVALLATLPTKEAADTLLQSINGAVGSYRDARRRIETDRSARLTAVEAKLNRTVDRLVASAIEAGTGETEGLDPQGESAIPQGDAHHG